MCDFVRFELFNCIHVTTFLTQFRHVKLFKNKIFSNYGSDLNGLVLSHTINYDILVALNSCGFSFKK